MRVAFRADASVQIGTGHLTRYPTLADVPQARGVQTQCQYRRLPGDPGDLILERDPALTWITGSGSVAEGGFLALVPDLAACRTLVVDSEKSPRRAQFLPDSPPHSRTMGQEFGEKLAVAVVSQQAIPKPDRLVVSGPVGKFSYSEKNWRHVLSLYPPPIPNGDSNYDPPCNPL